MAGEEARKIEAMKAIRYLAAILYRLSRIEAAPASAADPLEALRLCALARKQIFTAEKILE